MERISEPSDAEAVEESSNRSASNSCMTSLGSDCSRVCPDMIDTCMLSRDSIRLGTEWSDMSVSRACISISYMLR